MNQREINDLLISWLTISLAFAWIGARILSPGGTAEFISQFTIILIAVGTGFVLHELAHKYVAIHYGAHAEFRAWKEGLIFAVVLAFITNGEFVFAAPGAVYVLGNRITTKQNGIISLAGPVTNLAIVLVFGILLGALKPGQGFVQDIIVTVMHINFFLAAFNMIPVFPLDGSKVFVWSKGAWLATMLVAAAGVFFFPLIAGVFYAL